ncbi:hypothetical protein ACHHRT_02550 [Desulfurivibrio sp. D14AmB]|uniref:hypothetical protein n=1 Tax=Desulfurivibrio sp. D14AmB TaxID=3374370 RepID=UPI00376ED0DE
MARRSASTRRIILLFFLALFLFCRPEPSLSETASPLTISPARHDFGFMGVGSASPPIVFTINNKSALSQTISQITLAKRGDFTLDLNGGENPCGRGNPTLGPGESCTVTLSFRPFAMGRVNGSLRVKTAGPGPALESSALLRGLSIACGC